MATQVQTQPRPQHHPHLHSPKSVRKRLSYISPRNVVNIISPRRHSSHADFGSALRDATFESADVSRGSDTPRRQQKKLRTVSNPVRRMETSSSKTSNGDEEERGPPQQDRANDAQIGDGGGNGVGGGGGPTHSLSFPHVADLFIRLRRAQRKAKAHHIHSDSGPNPITHESLQAALNATMGVDADEHPGGTRVTLVRHARLEVQEMFVCVDAVDLKKLLRATRATLLERVQAFGADVLVEEQWACSICEPKHRNDGTYKVYVRYAATAATVGTPKASHLTSSLDSTTATTTTVQPAASSLTQEEEQQQQRISKNRQSPTRPRRGRKSAPQDPHQPVALACVRDIPGLMTIASRELASVSVVEVFNTTVVSAGGVSVSSSSAEAMSDPVLAPDEGA